MRYTVFAQEFGAKRGEAAPGTDENDFDPYCKHLLVRDKEYGMVVGTYRILAPHLLSAFNLLHQTRGGETNRVPPVARLDAARIKSLQAGAVYGSVHSAADKAGDIGG